MQNIKNLASCLSSIPEKYFVNSAISIVLISFLFMTSGCGNYRIIVKKNETPSTVIQDITRHFYPSYKYPRDQYPDGNLEKLLWMEHEFYLIDSKGQWFLEDISTKGDTLYARAVNSPLPAKDNPRDPSYKEAKRFQKNEKNVTINRIKLFVNRIQFYNNDTVFVPFSSIYKYDYYKPDNRGEIGIVIGILAGTALLIAIGVAISNYEPLPSSSCPFIYTCTEDTCQFEGEVFGGAIFRSLERDDYLALDATNARPGGSYIVKMANMLPEVQYINQAELVLVNHDTNVSIHLDKYGEIQTVSNLIRPVSACDSRGMDVLDLVNDPDGRTYNFSEDPDISTSCMNHLDLVFCNDTKPDSCKILVKGHNSLWIDLLTRGLLERLGTNYRHWVRLMDLRPNQKQKEWVLSQGLPLQLFLLKGGEWQYIDYFDIVGPMASREMVMPLDVRDAWSTDSSGEAARYYLYVRLMTGYNFWDLDNTAIDLNENVRVEKIMLQPVKAIDQDHEDASGLIAADDRRYLVQRETGDETMMEFVLPDEYNHSGSIFLHAKGYYHAVVDKNENSEFAFIWSFLEPGRLSEFSYESYLRFRELLTRNECQ